MNIKRWIYKLLLKLTPKSQTRFVALSSLIPQMSSSEISEKTLHNLNETLGIANNIAAMDIPMALSSDIWDEETATLIKKLSESRDTQSRETLTQVIFNNMPEWMRQGTDYSNLEKDLLVMNSILRGQKTGV